MNDTERKDRIDHLHSYRHDLLKKRDIRGSSIISIDMELNVVRSELQALYGVQRALNNPVEHSTT